MMADLPVDFGTVAVLALVVWLDGWRRLPAGTLLLGRVGSGPWNVCTPSMQIGASALVAWWAPIVVPVIIAPSPAGAAAPRWTGDFRVTVASGRRRLARTRVHRAVLRAYGVLLLAWIVIGIPLATGLLGGRGLIYGVLGAFGLAGVATFFVLSALRRLGLSARHALRMAAPLLSPFSAPRGVEIVTTEAVGPLRSLAPVAALMGDARFLAWLRPWAYDALAGREAGAEPLDGTIGTLVRRLPRAVLEQAVVAAAREAGDDGARYCPRCTRTYRDAVESCANCEDLALVAL